MTTQCHFTQLCKHNQTSSDTNCRNHTNYNATILLMEAYEMTYLSTPSMGVRVDALHTYE